MQRSAASRATDQIKKLPHNTTGALWIARRLSHRKFPNIIVHTSVANGTQQPRVASHSFPSAMEIIIITCWWCAPVWRKNKNMSLARSPGSLAAGILKRVILTRGQGLELGRLGIYI